MAILELIFIVLKIVCLSTVYASVILLLCFYLSKNPRRVWAKRIMGQKTLFWFGTHFLVSVSLFAFKFTYWQDTGLGDNSTIPVDYNQAIQSSEFVSTYFFPDLDKTDPNKDAIDIGNYSIQNEYLCAEISHRNTVSPDYDFMVYNLKEKKYITFPNGKKYAAYAKMKHLPAKPEFYNFEKHYFEFLDAKPEWKKWLLP